MDINYIFGENYTPKERRNLLMKEYTRKGLTLFGGNRKQTAKFLGISPRTLRIFMADNPELREEFPANVFTEQKYVPLQKVNEDDLPKARLYKSLLKYQYKIKGKVFDTPEAIADYYKKPTSLIHQWLKKKLTDDNDFIRTISIPISSTGKEVDFDDVKPLECI